MKYLRQTGAAHHCGHYMLTNLLHEKFGPRDIAHSQSGAHRLGEGVEPQHTTLRVQAQEARREVLRRQRRITAERKDHLK